MSENKGGLISCGRLIDICKQIASDDWNQRTSPPSWSDAYDSFVEELEEAPTVDAVEVVRCKDCKHHCIEETECGAKYIACNRFDEVMEADDFCSYGERKDGAGNGKAD